MNVPEHRLASSIALAAAAATFTETPEERLPRATFGCIGGYCFAGLPDLIEPATNPNHRQFFHSMVFVLILGYGLYRLAKWDPETPEAQVLRGVGLIAGGAYLVHLALDFTTKRSLPLVGRVG